MSDEGQPDDDPLAGMGAMFGDLGRLLGGSNHWESAAQMAASIANEGRSEANVDPSDRVAVEQLARVAELQVAEVVGSGFTEPLRTDAVNRGQWARRFLDDQRGVLEGLAGSLGNGLAAQLGQLEGLDDLDDLDLGELGLGDAGIRFPGFGELNPAMLEQLLSMMGPMLLSMMSGSTAGHLAARALGHYELPLPRSQPLSMVLSNVDGFAAEWSLPIEDIRLWVCLSDAAHHRVLSIPHVASTMRGMVGDYTRSFTDDPDLIESQADELGLRDVMGEGEPDMAALQRLAQDPDVLLGAMQSPHQRELIPRIDALVATIEGWVDHVVDSVGHRLIGEHLRVTEALRRRRVQAGPQTRFVERLLGLEMSQATFDRGAGFVAGVVARAGDAALAELWSDPAHLPTPNELDAPGLWLARVGIESAELPLDGDLDLDIPDAPDF